MNDPLAKLFNLNFCRHYRILDLFRTPNLRKKSCLIIFNSFSNYAVYSGLNFFVPHLGGDEHVNFIYGALIELPAYPAMYLCLNRFGRRFLLMVSMVVGGAFLIATALVPEVHYLTVILLFLTSKFFMTFSFFITDLMASELFPTVLRGAGASLTQTISTVGLCMSPLIAHLGSYNLWLPLVIFGVLGIVGGLVAVLLPETLNQNLPETLAEAEEFGKYMRWRDYLRFGKNSTLGKSPAVLTGPATTALADGTTLVVSAHPYADMPDQAEQPDHTIINGHHTRAPGEEGILLRSFHPSREEQ